MSLNNVLTTPYNKVNACLTNQYVTLSDIAAGSKNAIVDGPFGSSLKTSDYVLDGIPVLQGKNITGDTFRFFDVRFISYNKAEELIRSKVEVGDILLIKIGSIGYSAELTDLHGYPYAIIPANLAKLTLNKERAEHCYILHWLKSPAVKAYFLQVASKTAQPALSLQKIKDLPVFLPPLAQQKRIAAILDKADEIKRKREQAIAKLDQLAQSIFVEMFGDMVGNNKQWDDSKLLDDVAEIVSGITKGRKLNGASLRSIPYLAVLNVQDKSLNLSVIKTIEATEAEINRLLIRKNDLLLTEGGDADKLGRGTLWNNELPECIHQNHIFRVRTTSHTISPRFLNWLIGSQRGKKYFLKSAKQTTGIASINMTQLKSFPLLLPPIALQEQFATRISKLEKLKASNIAALEKHNQLFASLQNQAFTGQL